MSGKSSITITEWHDPQGLLAENPPLRTYALPPGIRIEVLAPGGSWLPCHLVEERRIVRRGGAASDGRRFVSAVDYRLVPRVYCSAGECAVGDVTAGCGGARLRVTWRQDEVAGPARATVGPTAAQWAGKLTMWGYAGVQVVEETAPKPTRKRKERTQRVREEAVSPTEDLEVKP